MTITLEIIDTPFGSACVLPSRERIKSVAKMLEAEAVDMDKLAQEAAGALKEAKAEGRDKEQLAIIERDHEVLMAQAKAKRESASHMIDRNEELRKRFEGKIREEQFDANKYTRGEKLKARRAATTFEGRTPIVDEEEYHLRLCAAGLGISFEKLLEMDAPIADALVREILERSEPSPEKLDFFF